MIQKTEFSVRNAKRLLEYTKECRDDMHEPDEQGISAIVLGTKLDNAFGDRIVLDPLEKGYQEIVVILENFDYKIERFNLASLIAMARIGAQTILKEEKE
jgi:hypothetical protein